MQEVDAEGNIKAKMLEVFLMKSPDSDEKNVGWTFFNNPNAYYLLGVLEMIKQDLLEKIKGKSFGEKVP